MIDLCECWWLDAYVGGFAARAPLRQGVATVNNGVVVVPLAMDVLGLARSPVLADVQVATCDASGQWTQLARRVVATAPGPPEARALAFRAPVAGVRAAVFVGSANPPPVIDTAADTLPSPLRGTSTLLAAWSMAGSVDTYGGVVAASMGTDLALQGTLAGAFKSWTGVGAMVVPARRAEGNLFTSSAPVALGGAGESVPVHVRAWVKRTSGSSDPMVIVRADNVLLDGTQNGWQLYMEDGFQRISFEVRDQRWGGSCNSVSNCFTRVDAGWGSQNTWMYLEAGWNPGGRTCLYINGNRAAFTNAPGGLRQVVGAASFAIGSRPGGSWPFRGEIAEVVVDDRPPDCQAPGGLPVPAVTPGSASTTPVEPRP